jgi:hypothetical protein
VVGDFNGDGLADLATVWNTGYNVIAMRQSKGTTFIPSTWEANAGGWSPTTHWLGGRFN